MTRKTNRTKYPEEFIVVFFRREHKETWKSRLPWKQRNSIDKPKMIRPSDEGEY